MSDPISDMLTRIRNAGAAHLPVVALPHSRIKESIARVLHSEGYLADVAVEGEVKKTIQLKLKFNGKKSVIEGLKRVSKPGLRRYVGSTEIPASAAVSAWPSSPRPKVSLPIPRRAGKTSAENSSATFGNPFKLCRVLENNRLPFPPKLRWK